MKREKSCSYDWAAYYQAAYEKEKKENMLLAGKLADLEAKEADVSAKIGHIENHIFWKASLPLRKGYHVLFSHREPEKQEQGQSKEQNQNQKQNKAQEQDQAQSPIKELPAGQAAEAAQAYRLAYLEETYRQKHPYLQWIAKQEDGCGDTGTETVNGWKVLPIQGSDLCVIAFGHGMLAEKIENEVKTWFNKNPNCLLAYTDEDYYWKDLAYRMHPWYKPCWSPDTFLSFCYMGHMIITKHELCNDLLPSESEYADDYSSFYDLCLRLEERVMAAQGTVSHIAKVLFHNCYEPSPEGEALIAEAGRGRAAGAPAGETEADLLEIVEKLLEEELEQGRDLNGCEASYRRIKEAALERRGIGAHIASGPMPGIYHVVYEAPPNALISVIIPSKDHPETLERCLRSFAEKTEYGNYEWIVVDNGSNAENKSHMEALQKEYGFLYLYEPMPFNFSAMCNMGARKANGDYLLLLNDDIEIIEKDWLQIMLGQAAQPHVGAVGAKLWYADSQNIQHVGITNLTIGPSHKLVTFPDDRNYYYGRNQVTYDMIGVTAACLMIGRDKYWEAGGMDETMKVAYNDVDFCFKLIEKGYYNVLRNDAVLYHAESLSRGLDEQDDGKWERLLQEKENLYAKHPDMEGHDIYYHPYLIDNASHYACNFKFDYQNNLKTIEIMSENAGNLAEAQEGVLMLTVDRAEEQHKIHREEEDIMFLMGWSYIPGKDNAKYARKLVLEHENGDICTLVPYPWHRKDVEAVLSKEVNVSLAGFVARIKKEKLHFGVWRIGMLGTDLDTQQQFLTWSDRKMTVE